MKCPFHLSTSQKTNRGITGSRWGPGGLSTRERAVSWPGLDQGFSGAPTFYAHECPTPAEPRGDPAGAHATQLKLVFCWCQSPRTLPPWNTHLLASLEAGLLRWPSAGSWEGHDPSFSGFPTCPTLGALSHFAHRASCPSLAGAPASQPPSVSPALPEPSAPLPCR